MINLLPPDVKSDITYGRKNTSLRKWCVVLGFCILGVLGIIVVGHLYLQQSIDKYSTQLEQGKEQLNEQKLPETQSRVNDISGSLKLVVQVLSREVLFSKLISQIGNALPNGSVLTDLSINTLQGGIDLRADALDVQTATQVQINLQDPENKIFEKADIINIQCTSAVTAETQYPCSVQVRALFAKNNPFQFVSSGVKP